MIYFFLIAKSLSFRREMVGVRKQCEACIKPVAKGHGWCGEIFKVGIVWFHWFLSVLSVAGHPLLPFWSNLSPSWRPHISLCMWWTHAEKQSCKDRHIKLMETLTSIIAFCKAQGIEGCSFFNGGISAYLGGDLLGVIFQTYQKASSCLPNQNILLILTSIQ